MSRRTHGNRYDDASRFRRCLCGCEKPIPVTSKRKYYNPACRARAARARRKNGIPPKRTGGRTPRGKSAADREIDELERHYVRVRLERGELTVCDRCGAMMVKDAEEPGGNYCGLCASIVALEDDGHA